MVVVETITAVVAVPEVFAPERVLALPLAQIIQLLLAVEEVVALLPQMDQPETIPYLAPLLAQAADMARFLLVETAELMAATAVLAVAGVVHR